MTLFGGSFTSAVAHAVDFAALKARMTEGLTVVAAHKDAGVSLSAEGSFTSAVAHAGDFAALKARMTAGLAVVAARKDAGVSLSAGDSFTGAVAHAADADPLEAKAKVWLELVGALTGGGGAVSCADTFWSVVSGIDTSALTRDATSKAAGDVKAAVQETTTGRPNLRLALDGKLWSGVSGSASVVERAKRLIKLCRCLRRRARSKELKLSTVTTLGASVLGQLGSTGTDDAMRQLAVSWWSFVVRDSSKGLSAPRARVDMPEPKRVAFEDKLDALRGALAAGGITLTHDAKLTNSGGMFAALATRSVAESTLVGKGLVRLNALLQAQGSAARLLSVDDDAFHCVLPGGFDEPAVLTRMAARLAPLFAVPEHLRPSLAVKSAVLPEHWRIGAAEQTRCDGALVGRDKILATLVKHDTVFQRRRGGRMPITAAIWRSFPKTPRGTTSATKRVPPTEQLNRAAVLMQANGLRFRGRDLLKIMPAVSNLPEDDADAALEALRAAEYVREVA